MSRRHVRDAEAGTITLLTLGFVMIGLLLIVVVVDVSAVFNARKGLLSECDAVALKAAQSLDVGALYAQGAHETLPINQDMVDSAVEDAAGMAQGLYYADTDGTTINVHGRRQVLMPFAPRLQWMVLGPVTAKADCSTLAHRR